MPPAPPIGARRRLARGLEKQIPVEDGSSSQGYPATSNGKNRDAAIRPHRPSTNWSSFLEQGFEECMGYLLDRRTNTSRRRRYPWTAGETYPYFLFCLLFVLVLAVFCIHSIFHANPQLPPQQTKIRRIHARDLHHPLSTRMMMDWVTVQRSRNPLELPILLPHNHEDNLFPEPEPLRDLAALFSEDEQDYGGLDNLRFPENDGNVLQPRRIFQEPWERQRPNPLEDYDDDDYHIYFAFDDDWVRSPYQGDPWKLATSQCRRPSWYRFQFPTCNILHELDVAESMIKHIGEGWFREVFSVYNKPGNEYLAFKEAKLSKEFNYVIMENIRIDALVAERFSHNPRFVNQYAFCAFSQVSELFEHGDIEDEFVGNQVHDEDLDPLREPELRPENDFTPSQKLHLALEMVEPLVAMHTELDGIIVHDDIDLGQYLWADGSFRHIKLNDFNRAEIMLWDEVNLEYCQYKNEVAGGYWRSPEEYRDAPLGPKIDVWSVGNNMYSLLTGHYPYFQIEMIDDIQDAIKSGKTPLIDPRYRSNSYAERKLVEIIEACHTYNPWERPTMTDIQQMLKEAIEENKLRRDEEEE